MLSKLYINHYKSGPSSKYKVESWKTSSGDLHRERGPAKITYYESGKVRFIEWWRNSKRHRTDGPAYIGRYETGKIKNEYWWLNGKDVYPEDWLEENGYKWPLTKQQQIEFLLVFG